MFAEKRKEPRMPMALRLKVGTDVFAVTRDISPSGLYFLVLGEHAFRVHQLFEMDLEEANMKFTAEGSIVRIDYHDGITGVAVTLIAGRLRSLA